jgi:hypothetical protein
LPILDKEISSFYDKMTLYNQTLNMMEIKSMWQMMRILMNGGGGGGSSSSINSSSNRSARSLVQLNGDIMDENEQESWKELNPGAYVWSFTNRMILAYLFGDYDTARSMSLRSRDLIKYPFWGRGSVLAHFFDALVQIEYARSRNYHCSIEATRRLRDITQWAEHAPMNFVGMKDLIGAELAALARCHGKAVLHYVSAIALSQYGGFTMQTALAHERYGKYLLRQERSSNNCNRSNKNNNSNNMNVELATEHLHKALDLYEQWGGLTKRQHLEAEIPVLILK